MARIWSWLLSNTLDLIKSIILEGSIFYIGFVRNAYDYV